MLRISLLVWLAARSICSLPGLCSKWYAQNATFMNSATQHKITASGT